MDNRAIADAIAGCYTGLVASDSFSGTSEGLAAPATRRLPNKVMATPIILVYPPEGDYLIGVSAIRQGAVQFLVRMLRDPFDIPSRTDWLYAWDNAMRDRIETTDLNLSLPGYVAEAEVTHFRLVLDGIEYSGASAGLSTFDLVEHTVSVRLYEVGIPVQP